MQYTIQQIFTQFKDLYLKKYNPSYEQMKVLTNISNCRTERMGTRIYVCEKCGEDVFTYDSCCDRHCPNCQNYQKEKWINKHQNDIFDTPYFHVVTTVPTELHAIFIRINEKCTIYYLKYHRKQFKL